MRLFPLPLLLLACWIGPAPFAASRAQPPSLALPALALTTEQLATLPQHQASLSYGNPPAPHGLQGPLLWDVLTSSGVVDPARHADAVRQWLTVRAADGYTAVLALAEIAPDFAAKPVILATVLDGMPLDRPRMVVPAERRAGRSVRDVVALTIESMPEPSR